MLRKSLFFIAALGCLMGTAWAKDVSLKADDGTVLHADYQAVNGAKRGVVLVHMNGRSAKDWRFVSEKLTQAGLATIAVDLRGHGANVPEGSERPELSEQDYLAMTQDVAAAVRYLRDQGVTDISIVGASLGANPALRVASKDPTVKQVILLSPGMNYKGHDAGAALTAYGERPVLIVASQEDRVSAMSAAKLDGMAKGPHKLEMYNGAGHGTKMLSKEPGLEPLLVSWLLGTTNLSDANVGGSSPDLSTGDTTSIQTTGKKLGDD